MSNKFAFIYIIKTPMMSVDISSRVSNKIKIKKNYSESCQKSTNML